MNISFSRAAGNGGPELLVQFGQLLDPPVTDHPGDFEASAYEALSELILTLQPIAEILRTTAETLGALSNDYDDYESEEEWRSDIELIDETSADQARRLRRALDDLDQRFGS